jgi:hypothetical protein
VRLGRGAPSRRVTSARGKRSRARLSVIAAVVCSTLGSACGRHAAIAEDVSVEWEMTPTASIDGTPSLGILTLRDGARRPLGGARLQVVGHMSHPGMAPVVATVTERGDGVYQVDLRFTMNGDWILLVSGSLPDGRRLNHRIDIANRRPAG